MIRQISGASSILDTDQMVLFLKKVKKWDKDAELK